MNIKLITQILGKLFLLEAIFMIPALLVAVIYKGTDVMAFLMTIGILLVVGGIMGCIKPKKTKMFARDGMMIVSLAWILLSVFGALPFVFSGAIPRFIDAFFETVSGFTTTGSSILTEIESLPKGILFWRSFTGATTDNFRICFRRINTDASLFSFLYKSSFLFSVHSITTLKFISATLKQSLNLREYRLQHFFQFGE